MVENEPKAQNAPAGGATASLPSDAFRDLLAHCTAMLEAAVAKSDGRFTARLMRHIKTLRGLLRSYATSTVPLLRQSVASYAEGAEGCAVAALALQLLPEPKATQPEKEAGAGVRLHYTVAPVLGVQEFLAKNSQLAETKVFLLTLALIHLMDTSRLAEAMELAAPLAQHVLELKSRTADHLSAKVYFYYARVFELGGRFYETRHLLMNAYRRACLHHERMTQAVCFNCVMRNLVHHKLYSSASTLLAKAPFPDSISSNAQHARYLYYYGKILAVQLEYSQAYNKLTQAIRKAPQSDKAGFGFKLAATKMSVIVALLMGDVPSKSTFTNPAMKRSLRAYEDVVLAVMNGDLAAFTGVCDSNRAQFEKDGTLFLIARLRHNVIKGGLRKINLAYSRIPIERVAQMLGIKSVEDTEAIVAKAIHDGIIEATIHHEEKYMQSKATVNLYTSDQPMRAFHKRIDFLLKLHANAVQAMRYPDEPDIVTDQAPSTPIDEEQIAAMAEEEGLGDGDLL